MKKLLIFCFLMLMVLAVNAQAPKLQRTDTITVPAGADTTFTYDMSNYNYRVAGQFAIIADYRSLSGIADTCGIIDYGYVYPATDTMYLRFDDTRLPKYLCDTVNCLFGPEKFYLTIPFIRVKFTNAGATAGQKIVMRLFK